MARTTTTETTPPPKRTLLTTDLFDQIQRVLEREEAVVNSIEISEAADGSRRTIALIHLIDYRTNRDRTLQIATPAPDDAPAWARVEGSEYAKWQTRDISGIYR
jgi:hypothetical protein